MGRELAVFVVGVMLTGCEGQRGRPKFDPGYRQAVSTAVRVTSPGSGPAYAPQGRAESGAAELQAVIGTHEAVDGITSSQAAELRRVVALLESGRNDEAAELAKKLQNDLPPIPR